MKNFFNKLCAVLLLVAATASWSCNDCDHEPYDDTEIKNQIQDLYSKLSQLEAKLQSEVNALTAMISGQVTIASHSKDADGNWTIKLSDGTSFVVYAEYQPEALPTSLVYVMEVDGQKVWAVIGSDGQLTPLKDADGNNIPVVPAKVEIPAAPTIQTRITDGVIEISIDGGETWHATGLDPEALPEQNPNEGGACTGAACANIVEVTVNTMEDQWGDQVPCSVTFTLSDGSSFTVALDGTEGVAFQYWGEAVETLFVGQGMTESNLTLWQNQMVDYIKEVPQGWKISISEPNRYGEIAVAVTAPKAETVAAGVAEAEGTIKLVAVFESGKTAIAKLNVTSEPFAEVSASAGQVVVKPNTGIEMFVYGILPASEYTEEGLTETLNSKLVNGLWSGWNAPYNAKTWYEVIDTTAAEVYGQELTPGVEYVLWAATVKKEQQGWEYIYSLSSQIYTKNFSQMLVEVETTAVSFNDIIIKLNFLGFDRYFGSVTEKHYFDAESQLSYINGSYEMGFGEPTSYANDAPTAQTSIQNMPCSDVSGIQPNKSYVMWIIPVEEGKTVYTESDMKIFEWTTPALQPGGEVVITAGEPTIDLTSISTELSYTGGTAAYYKYYKSSELPSEEVLLEELLYQSPVITPDMPEAAYNLTPGTEYTLAAVGVDKDGKYGQVYKFTFTTTAITYNNLKVVIDTAASELTSTSVKLKWSVEGGTAKEYIYYINRASHSTWKNNMGATAEGAAAYIALNPSMYTLTHTTSTEASYNVSSYYAGQPHVAVVVAVDENGVTSEAAVIEFTPGA